MTYVLTVAQKVRKAALRRARYLSDPSKERAKNKEWSRLNRAKKQAHSNAWRKRHPTASAAASKAWRDAHPDRQAKANKQWSTKNRAAKLQGLKNWRHRNPESFLNAAAARRARTKTPLTTEERKRVRLIYNFCIRLNANLRHTHPRGLFNVDHVKPLARGGLHHPDNLRITTAAFNMTKHAKWARQAGFLHNF